MSPHLFYLFKAHAAVPDKFSIELCVASHAVLHDYLRAGRNRLQCLSLAADGEYGRMTQTVHRFEVVSSHLAVLRYVAVVAGGVPAVGAVHPGSIIRSHDMAVDTGGRVVGEIAVCAGSKKRIDKQSHESATDNDRRIFPSTARSDFIPYISQFVHGSTLYKLLLSTKKEINK